MAQCLIGLGANLGDRATTLSQAVERLRSLPGTTLLNTSRWFSTEPIGGPPDQPTFLNGAITLETSLEPLALAAAMHDVEQALGRRRRERWGPRAVDLDLLLYDQLVLDTPELTVPHPRLAFRRFVLEPAVEVAPQWLHPTTGWTLAQLWQHLLTATPYVAITGAIGSGKSSVAQLIAQRQRVRLVHEIVDLPRLATFYADPAGRGLTTEIEFLDQRRQQLAEVVPTSGMWTLSDFWFDQSLAFAAVWLSETERQALRDKWRELRSTLIQPKLLVVLEAPAVLLRERIVARGRAPEQLLTADDLQNLATAINGQIADSHAGPVLRVSGVDLDAAADEIAAALAAMQPPE